MSETYLNLFCAYAGVDEELFEKFKRHCLTPLRSLGYLSQWYAKDITHESGRDIDNKLYNADLVILLVTPGFVATRYADSYEVKTALKLHHQKRTFVLPIHFLKSELAQMPFRRWDSLPENGIPVGDSQWFDENQALYNVYESLKIKIPEISERKFSLERFWELISHRNTVEGYQSFLARYPRSKFTVEARKRIDNLQEKALWAQVEEAEDVESALAYLSEAPLLSFQQAARNLIQKAEEDEDMQWHDAAENEELSLYLAYKLRYPEGKHREEADAWIRAKLTQNFGFGQRPDGFSLEAKYLDYHALEKLEQDEFFSYLQYKDYAEHIKEVLIGEKFRAMNKASSISFYGMVIPFFLALIWFLFLRAQVSTYQFVAVVVFILFVTYRLNDIFFQYSNRFQAEFEKVKKQSVELRTHLAFDREANVKPIVEDFLSIEQLVRVRQYERTDHLISLMLWFPQINRRVGLFFGERISKGKLWPLLK